MNHPYTATGALFDMDGLLLDTESIYTVVTQHIVSQYGKNFDWSIKSNMIGRPAIDSARYLVSTLALPITGEQYLEQRELLLRERFANAQALPGAERLIRHLKAHQIPIALATSSSHELYELKTQNHRSWFDLFDVIVTGEHPDINNGKPAPDIFQVAARLIQRTPEQCLVFEDAPSGLQAGISAGCPVIAIPDPNMEKSRYSDATEVLDSLLDFQPQHYGLPPFE